MSKCIGKFRGGSERAQPSRFFFLSLTRRFCFENRFIICSLILPSETLTLLYFASRIRKQCCILHVLKSEAFIRCVYGGGRGPIFLNILGPPLSKCNFNNFQIHITSGANP